MGWRWFNGIRPSRVAGEVGQGANNRGADRAGHGDPARSFGLDDAGRPRVFYHGTRDSIDAFDLAHPNRKDNGWLGNGVYLGNDPKLAASYATLKRGGEAPNVMPLYAAVHNPYVANLDFKRHMAKLDKTAIGRVTDKLKVLGYDGVVLEFLDGTQEVVAFDPTQVKSAIGNTGAFSPDNANILHQAPRNNDHLAPNGKPSKLNAHQWAQVRTAEFKAWFGDWESAAILTGQPVASLKAADAPDGGYAAVETWAANIFEQQGGKAVREGLGEVTLDRRAAKDSMAHGGANRYKKVAFAAVKDVIERGALVHESHTGEEDSFYFSAPVDIDGTINIETVVVHRDVNTQRMYLHSVTTKENLLNQRVSSADDLTPQRSGSTDSEGITKILQNIINRKNISKVIDENGEPLVVYHGTQSREKPSPRLIWVG